MKPIQGSLLGWAAMQRRAHLYANAAEAEALAMKRGNSSSGGDSSYPVSVAEPVEPDKPNCLVPSASNPSGRQAGQ